MASQREPTDGIRPRSNADRLPKARIDGFVTRTTPVDPLASAVFCHRSSPGKISGGFFFPVAGTAVFPWGRIHRAPLGFHTPSTLEDSRFFARGSAFCPRAEVWSKQA